MENKHEGGKGINSKVEGVQDSGVNPVHTEEEINMDPDLEAHKDTQERESGKGVEAQRDECPGTEEGCGSSKTSPVKDTKSGEAIPEKSGENSFQFEGMTEKMRVLLSRRTPLKEKLKTDFRVEKKEQRRGAQDPSTFSPRITRSKSKNRFEERLGR